MEIIVGIVLCLTSTAAYGLGRLFGIWSLRLFVTVAAGWPLLTLGILTLIGAEGLPQVLAAWMLVALALGALAIGVVGVRDHTERLRFAARLPEGRRKGWRWDLPACFVLAAVYVACAWHQFTVIAN